MHAKPALRCPKFCLICEFLIQLSRQSDQQKLRCTGNYTIFESGSFSIASNYDTIHIDLKFARWNENFQRYALFNSLPFMWYWKIHFCLFEINIHLTLVFGFNQKHPLLEWLSRMNIFFSELNSQVSELILTIENLLHIVCKLHKTILWEQIYWEIK